MQVLRAARRWASSNRKLGEDMHADSGQLEILSEHHELDGVCGSLFACDIMQNLRAFINRAACTYDYDEQS